MFSAKAAAFTPALKAPRAALSTNAAAFVPAAVVATNSAPGAASGSPQGQRQAEAGLEAQPEGLPVQAPASVAAEAATQEAVGKHEVHYQHIQGGGCAHEVLSVPLSHNAAVNQLFAAYVACCP